MPKNKDSAKYSEEAKRNQVGRLIEKVKGNYWTGREYLPIPDNIKALATGDADAFWQLDPVKQLLAYKDDTEEGKIIKPILDNGKELPSVLSLLGLSFLETSHSANRAYNSGRYSLVEELRAKVEELLNNLLFGKSENLFYQQNIKSFNHVLKVPQWGESKHSKFKSNYFLQTFVPGTEWARPVAEPTVPVMINQLESTLAFALGLIETPTTFVQPGTLSSISTITKFSSVVGESVSRYSLAELFKAGTAPLLPSASAGTTNAVWLTLMEFAPYILVASVVVAIALKMSEKKLTYGSDFHLFREINGEPAGYAHSYYPRLEESQYQAAMQDLLLYFSELSPLDNIRIAVLDGDDPVAVYDCDQKNPIGQFLEIARESSADKVWVDLKKKHFEPIAAWSKDWQPYKGTNDDIDVSDLADWAYDYAAEDDDLTNEID